MPDTAAQLLKRWEQMRSYQAPARTLWQEIAEYVRPSKSNITTQRLEGQKKTAKLYDATAPHALRLLASSLHASMTPATQPWLSLKMRDEALNDIKVVIDWLEDCARRMHRAFRQSTFNQSVHELWLDLACFGTGALLVEEKPPTSRGFFGGFRFRVPAIGTFTISENADGQADTLFRLFSLPLRSAYAQWGEAIGEALTQKLAQTPDMAVEILHAVSPRTDARYDERTGRPMPGGRNMPWASCYVVVPTKRKVAEGGFEEFPYMVPRWEKDSGEVYGSGPSHTALPDVASLNAVKEILLKAAPLAMTPPTYERDDSVVGDLDLAPGGRNVISAAGSIPDSFGFITSATRLDVTQFNLAELRQGIRLVYFTDQLIMHEKPNMTATEVLALQEQMQRLLGPTTGRLESEFLNPLVQRAFAIMARARAFRPLPKELQEVVAEGMADLDVEYEGPLARAQRTIELAAQDRVVGFIAAVAEGKAKAPGEEWDLLDTDRMIRARADITGLPSDQLRAQEVIAQERQARQEAATQQAQMDGLERAAIAAGKMTPLLKAAEAPTNGAGR